MEGKTDRRSLRSKRLLRASLLELLEEKRLDRITVSDLCSRADINRGTFYLHFSDIYAFIEQNTNEVLDGLRAIVAEVNLAEFPVFAAKDEPFPTAIAALEYVADHADFFRLMLGPKGDPSFAARIKGLMMEQLMKQLSGHGAAERQMPVPLGYFVAFATSAQLGVMQHWFETGMRETPHELALFVTRMVTKGPAATAGF